MGERPAYNKQIMGRKAPPKANKCEIISETGFNKPTFFFCTCLVPFQMGISVIKYDKVSKNIPLFHWRQRICIRKNRLVRPIGPDMLIKRFSATSAGDPSLLRRLINDCGCCCTTRLDQLGHVEQQPPDCLDCLDGNVGHLEIVGGVSSKNHFFLFN